MVELAKLSSVKPQDVWPHEAYDFTPWLLENAEAVAEVLGIDLELTASEYSVGSFALDLIGRDLTNDCVLIVENQLTATDHGHLGQLLTYAAGTSAATVVWMATAFREEHRQALDWLNELAQGNARFFGVEIGVVRIADSAPAPLFRLRAQPNDWFAQVATATKKSTQTGGKSPYYFQFWERFLERVHVEHPTWTNSQKPGSWNWLSMPCPFKGGPCFSSGFAMGGKVRTELYIDFSTPEAVASLFAFLYERRDEIEATYGKALEWEELPGKRASRVSDYAAGDVMSVDQHESYIDWFFDSGDRLRAALASAAAAWLPQD